MSGFCVLEVVVVSLAPASVGLASGSVTATALALAAVLSTG
jgi:hypothetical protein